MVLSVLWFAANNSTAQYTPQSGKQRDFELHFIHEFSTFQPFWVVRAVMQKFFNIGVKYAKYILSLFFHIFKRQKNTFLIVFYIVVCTLKKLVKKKKNINFGLKQYFFDFFI